MLLGGLGGKDSDDGPPKNRLFKPAKAGFFRILLIYKVLVSIVEYEFPL